MTEHTAWTQYKAEEVNRLEAQLQTALEENDKLRGLLAKGKGDCVYCQLPAEDVAKCPHGFPGCARMDDLMLAINSPIESRLEKLTLDLMEERDTLKAVVKGVYRRGVTLEGQATNDMDFLRIETPLYPSIDEIIASRQQKHAWVECPTWIETDRTDNPCFLCINSKDDPIHSEA